METWHCWEMVPCYVKIDCIWTLWREEFDKLICRLSYLRASTDAILLYSKVESHPSSSLLSCWPVWHLDVVAVCIEDLGQENWMWGSLGLTGGPQEDQCLGSQMPGQALSLGLQMTKGSTELLTNQDVASPGFPTSGAPSCSTGGSTASVDPLFRGPHMLPFPLLSTLPVTSSVPSAAKTLFSWQSMT